MTSQKSSQRPGHQVRRQDVACAFDGIASFAVEVERQKLGEGTVTKASLMHPETRRLREQPAPETLARKETLRENKGPRKPGARGT